MLLLRGNETIEVATDEVADNQAGVEEQYLGKVCHSIAYGYGEVVERIGQAVRESAIDEERYTEEQRQGFAFAGEGDNGGHDESAADSEQTRTHGTYGQAAFEDALCSTAQIHR